VDWGDDFITKKGGFDGLVPEIRLLASEFFPSAKKCYSPCCDATGGIIFISGDLKLGAVGAADISDFLLDDLGFQASIGLAILKTHLYRLCAVISAPENSVIVAKTLVHIGSCDSSIKKMVSFEFNSAVHCSDGCPRHQMVVFDLGDFATRPHAHRGAGGRDGRQQHQYEETAKG
jgi:hypothetical protein